MRSLCTVFYISCLLCIGSGRGLGVTVAASGCSGPQVQSAINAAKNGDTVQIPAGSATWTVPVTVVGKSITLAGAGIGRTNITRNMGISDVALDVSLSRNQTFSLSGFTFSTVTSAQKGQIAVGGDSSGYGANFVPQFRITNCRVNVAPSSPTVSYRGIVPYTYGLIDHCYITNASDSGQGISVTNETNIDLTHCWTYSSPQVLGDQNAVVIEDCTFDFDSPADGAFDAYAGCKVVFRHNTVINTNIGWHGADSATRSLRSFEIYQNTFSTDSRLTSNIYTAIRSRGGTGVVWGNTIAGNYNSFFILSAYRADPAYSSAVGILGSNVDGNFDATHYPILDQTGRGSFPANTTWPNQSSYTPAQYEALDPMYQWGNNVKGDTSPTCDVGLPDQSSAYIKPNRDYYDNTPKPGYVPLTYPHPLVSRPGAPQNLRLAH